VYVLPLLVSAWMADARAVAIAAVLAVLSALFLEPGGGVSGLGGTGWVRLGVFVAIAISIVTLVRRLRAKEQAEQETLAELLAADARLRQALDAARMVAWRWDRATDVVVRTGRARELFGVDETGTGRGLYEVIHPLDRERYRQAAADAIARRGGFDIVFRALPPDGRPVLWVEQRAAPIQAPDGGFGGFTGVAQDVTARHALEAAVRARELQLNVIIDAVPALIAYIDREQRYRLVNRAYEEWFGEPRERTLGRRIEDVLGLEYSAELRPHVEAALAGRHVEFESELVRRDGTRRAVRVSYVPDMDGDEVRGLFALVVDVTDHRRREQALAAAEREAREASELKDQFLATLSHELRTPLNAMLGYARMAQLGAVAPARAIEIIERNARLQARLVEDLLDVSRMVSGKLQFAMGRVDAATVAQDVVLMLLPLAEAKGVSLAAALPPGMVPRVAGDEARLRQMLVNLVSNAIKFTPEGGCVTVRVEARGASLDLAVEDSGIGLAPDQLRIVFDRFRQGDSSASREHGGLGLGLSIARTIVEAHGGTIAAASPGPGLGATFTASLPIEVPAPDNAAPA
jgi:PAS domain S-box-containing protein